MGSYFRYLYFDMNMLSILCVCEGLSYRRANSVCAHTCFGLIRLQLGVFFFPYCSQVWEKQVKRKHYCFCPQRRQNRQKWKYKSIKVFISWFLHQESEVSPAGRGTAQRRSWLRWRWGLCRPFWWTSSSCWSSCRLAGDKLWRTDLTMRIKPNIHTHTHTHTR